jgi:hypothetical protein
LGSNGLFEQSIIKEPSKYQQGGEEKKGEEEQSGEGREMAKGVKGRKEKVIGIIIIDNG